LLRQRWSQVFWACLLKPWLNCSIDTWKWQIQKHCLVVPWDVVQACQAPLCICFCYGGKSISWTKLSVLAQIIEPLSVNPMLVIDNAGAFFRGHGCRYEHIKWYRMVFQWRMYLFDDVLAVVTDFGSEGPPVLTNKWVSSMVMEQSVPAQRQSFTNTLRTWSCFTRNWEYKQNKCWVGLGTWCCHHINRWSMVT
jgi:hypothetical protein